jgi:hypothetical protein
MHIKFKMLLKQCFIFLSIATIHDFVILYLRFPFPVMFFTRKKIQFWRLDSCIIYPLYIMWCTVCLSTKMWKIQVVEVKHCDNWCRNRNLMLNRVRPDKISAALDSLCCVLLYGHLILFIVCLLIKQKVQNVASFRLTLTILHVMLTGKFRDQGVQWQLVILTLQQWMRNGSTCSAVLQSHILSIDSLTMALCRSILCIIDSSE